jgi:hypothetical protein
MKTYGAVEVKLHEILTLALHNHDWSASHSCFLIPKKSPSSHWIRGCAGPTVSLDTAAKKRKKPCQELNPGSPAHYHEMASVLIITAQYDKN